MDDNEIQKNFADGESWPLHWDIRRYLMTERNEQDRWLTDFSKAWSGPRDHTRAG